MQQTKQDNIQTDTQRFSGAFVTTAVVVAIATGILMGARGSEVFSIVMAQFGVATAGFDTVDLTEAQAVYRALKSRYNGDIDEEKLSQYASKGIVSAAGDPYTEYYTPEEAEELEKDLSGSIGGGVGAELGLRNNKVTVIRPLKGTPAEQAGVQAGDIIVAVNDEITLHATIDETVRKIRGEVGTTVKLTVQRGNDRKDIAVKRAEIVSPDVETSVHGTIGVIKLSRFGSDSGQKVRAAAESMKRQGLKGIVLDLRGNGGGYLQTGVDVAGVWLNNKTVVGEKGKYSPKKTLKSGKQPILEGVPTVVLINAGSASASEIVAGALKDHKAATLIGEKSYGKGSVQEIIELPKGDILKVTVASWYTPAGKNISKEGITPDKNIELTSDDVNNDRDPQLAAALEALRSK